jgi:hypothetical protein
MVGQEGPGPSCSMHLLASFLLPLLLARLRRGQGVELKRVFTWNMSQNDALCCQTAGDACYSRGRCAAHVSRHLGLFLDHLVEHPLGRFLWCLGLMNADSRCAIEMKRSQG